MAWTTYDSFLRNQLNGTAVVDFDTDTIKLALATNSYTPTRATHDFFNDVTNEVTGTGYTAGGYTLANVAVSVAGNTISLTADNPAQIAQSGGGFSNARVWVLYKDTGTPTTSPLIAYNVSGADFGNVAGPLDLDISAGLLDFDPNP